MRALHRVVMQDNKKQYETLRDMLLEVKEKYLMTSVTIHNMECLRHEIYTFLQEKFDIVNNLSDCNNFGYFFYYTFGNKQDGLYYICGSICNWDNGFSCKIEGDPDFNVCTRL